MEINNRTVRFSDADWYKLAKDSIVVVGGAGGICSWLSLMLSRIGCQQYIFDFDLVEEVNMAGQLYMTSDIGASKTAACVRNIERFSNDFRTNCFERYDSESMSNNYVFSGFDNMEARKIMFANWVKYYNENKDDEEISKLGFLFVDGRLSAENFQVFFVTPDKIEDYKATLFNDDEVEDLPCSYKSTSHIAAMIASNMVVGFTNFLANIQLGFEVREIPFKVTFDAHLMLYEVKLKEDELIEA